MVFFFQWDPSQVKIAKPKHLLLINTDLAFDEKLKHAGFTELKNSQPSSFPSSHIIFEEKLLGDR